MPEPETPTGDTSAQEHTNDERDELERFLSSPERVEWSTKAMETMYELAVSGVASLRIVFDEHNACTGYAEYSDEISGSSFELDRNQIDAVCEFINRKLQLVNER